MGLIVILLVEFLLTAILHAAIGLEDSLMIIGLLLVYTLFDCITIYNDKRIYNFRNQIIFGLLLRILLLYFDIYGKEIFILPNSGMDSEEFYHSAVSIATGSNWKDMGVFAHFIGGVMKYVGTSRLFAQYVVVAFSIVSLMFIAYTIEEIEIGERQKNNIMWIIALLPNFAILGSIFLRESLVTMFVAMSCFTFMLWMKGGSGYIFLVSIGLVFAGAQFHSGVIGIAAGFLVVRILYDNKTRKIHVTTRNILAAAFFIIIFTYIFINYGDVLFSKIAGIENIGDIANTTAIGDSSYAIYVGDSRSITNMFLYTPLRIFYFLASPFPWQWRGITDIIAFLFSSLFYLYSISMSIKKWRYLQDEQKVQLLLWLIISTAVTFVFAWGVSNTGTATRHRDKLIPIYTIVLSYSLANGQNDNQKSRTIYEYRKSNN